MRALPQRCQPKPARSQHKPTGRAVSRALQAALNGGMSAAATAACEAAAASAAAPVGQPSSTPCPAIGQPSPPPPPPPQHDDAEPLAPSLLQLPDDALLGVFSHLAPSAVAAAGSSCRRLRAVAAAPHMWRRFCELRWQRPLPHLAPAGAPAGRMTGGTVVGLSANSARVAAGTTTAQLGDADIAAADARQHGGHPVAAVPAAKPKAEAAAALEQENVAAPNAQSAGSRKRRRPAYVAAAPGASSATGQAEHAANTAQQAAAAAQRRKQSPEAAAGIAGGTTLPGAAKQRLWSEAHATERPAKLRRLVAIPYAGALPAAVGTTSAPGVATCEPAAGEPKTDWQQLYASGNGWAAPHFRRWRLPRQPQEPYEFVSAMAVAAAATAGLPAAATEDVLLLASSCSVDVFDTGDASGSVPRRLGRCALRSSDIMYSLAAVGDGRIAAGGSDGAIQVLRLTADGGSGGQLPGPQPLRAPDVWSPVVDMRVGGGRLLALHDATFSLDDAPLLPQRNVLRAVDLERQVELGASADFLESYELVAFDVADPEGNSTDIVAGAVHGGFCGRCFRGGLPSLCHHKSPAHAAALCTFDARAGPAATARFGIHHRSLYPNLRVARQHYVFTSHAGAPLAVWDRRRMSCPLYEEEHLPHFPGARACAGLPLPPPTRAAEHQGLFLDTDGDRLVGRAENGMLWTWDLSRTLGWQSQATAQRSGSLAGDFHAPWGSICGSGGGGGGGAGSGITSGGSSTGSAARGGAAGHGAESWLLPGEGVGCWLTAASLPEETKPRVAPWPAPLGALPCDTGMPVTIVRPAPAAQLFCLATLGQRERRDGEPCSDPGEDCVVALALT